MTAIPLDEHASIDFEIHEGNTGSTSITVAGADWHGTYTALIGGVASATLVGTYSSPDTTLALELTAVESAKLTPGFHQWHADNPAGDATFSGWVSVIPIG